MTRYVEAFSWTDSIERFVKWHVHETPLLHVCSGRSSFGDTTCDLYEPADVNADWRQLPFEDDSFGAVFADPPWNSGYKEHVRDFMREAMRVAPVAYLMAPWLYGGARAPLSRVWVRQLPGVHAPILLTRYERNGRQLSLKATGDEPLHVVNSGAEDWIDDSGPGAVTPETREPAA